MGHTSLRQLDGELKSSLIFEFQPGYGGGIFSGAISATPEGEGFRFPATNGGLDPNTAMYVRFKGNPFVDFCANMYVYIGYRTSGTSTLPINLNIYGQRVFLQASPDLTGPILYSLVPPGNTTYASTYEDISATYTMKVENITRNSLVRFEICRVADTNPDDLILEDVNFLIIPSYVDLTKLNLYPAAPTPTCPPVATPGILSNKGELLSYDGIQDVSIPPPGGSPRVLTHTGVGATNIEWVDPSIFTGAGKLYSAVTISGTKTMVAAEADLIHKVENPGASFDITLEDPALLSNGNYFVFQLLSTNVGPVVIKSPAGVALFDLTDGDVGPTGSGIGIQLSTVGETIEVITDGSDWYVYNIYEEGSGAVVSSPGVVALPYDTVTPGISIGDFVYIDTSSPTGFVKPAVATSITTMPAVGVVAGALGAPGAGLVNILMGGTISTSNYVVPVAPEVPGTQYIMSTTPGYIVAVNDTLNAAYPSGAGEIAQTVAILLTIGAPNTFYVNPDITTLEL